MNLGRTGGGRRRRGTVTTVIVRAYTRAPLMFQTRRRCRARSAPCCSAWPASAAPTEHANTPAWRMVAASGRLLPTAKLPRASHLPRCETFFFSFLTLTTGTESYLILTPDREGSGGARRGAAPLLSLSLSSFLYLYGTAAAGGSR